LREDIHALLDRRGHRRNGGTTDGQQLSRSFPVSTKTTSLSRLWTIG
jgi:hypothetical protein